MLPPPLGSSSRAGSSHVTSRTISIVGQMCGDNDVESRRSKDAAKDALSLSPTNIASVMHLQTPKVRRAPFAALGVRPLITFYAGAASDKATGKGETALR